MLPIVPAKPSISDLADAVESGFRRAFAQLELEQAVYGHDVLDEIALHPILAESLRDAGFGVHREQRYPADRIKRKVSEGERCDFVLTPDGLELSHPDAGWGGGTLFDPPDAVQLDDAFWLEVKIVSQFTIEGPNRNYATQLMSAVHQDVFKLSKDPGILHAGLLIVLFVRDEQVAQHDLKVWHTRCIERGLPIAMPALRTVSITDRHGHGVCVIAVYPVSHL